MRRVERMKRRRRVGLVGMLSMLADSCGGDGRVCGGDWT